MFKYVSPELYNRYKEKVLNMGLAVQYYDGTTMRRQDNNGLTDQEIADRLALDVDDVREIRCIAEIDLLPADAWLEAAKWKRTKSRQAFRSRKRD